jgi:hypothetical protein
MDLNREQWLRLAAEHRRTAQMLRRRVEERVRDDEWGKAADAHQAAQLSELAAMEAERRAQSDLCESARQAESGL